MPLLEDQSPLQVTRPLPAKGNGSFTVTAKAGQPLRAPIVQTIGALLFLRRPAHHNRPRKRDDSEAATLKMDGCFETTENTEGTERDKRVRPSFFTSRAFLVVSVSRGSSTVA